MVKTRQDAWTEKEDKLLTQIVLTYIQSGNTQMRAFEKAGIQLNRTPAACGFRWNAFLRKKNEILVNEAKEMRNKQRKPANIRPYPVEGTEMISSIIKKLQEIQVAQQGNANENVYVQLEKVEAENSKLKEQLKRYEHAWKEMNKLWECSEGHIE